MNTSITTTTDPAALMLAEITKAVREMHLTWRQGEELKARVQHGDIETSRVLLAAWIK